MIHHNPSQNQPEILDQTIDNTLYKHYTSYVDFSPGTKSVLLGFDHRPLPSIFAMKLPLAKATTWFDKPAWIQVMARSSRYQSSEDSSASPIL